MRVGEVRRESVWVGRITLPASRRSEHQHRCIAVLYEGVDGVCAVTTGADRLCLCDRTTSASIEAVKGTPVGITGCVRRW